MSSNELSLYVIPALLLVYWLTCRNLRVNNLVLLIGSYWLYSWGHPLWGLLLFCLSWLDYWLVRKLFASAKYRRAALYLGLVINVGAWLLVKYGSSTGTGALTSFGFPLGMSFYLLRKLSYLLDSYRGNFSRPHSFIEYALYVSFYPQILSGPIERPEMFVAQLQQPRSLTWERTSHAFPLLLMGLFKKMVIADNLGMIVDRIFRLDAPSRLMLAAGSLGFTFELYADFSGYTDLSRGFACLLGFETSENFDHPYLALTPQDFWNRWHMTLSQWLRDYIFFPLRRWLLRKAGGSRWLVDWTVPIITMLLSGLWHGTGWTYLLWGFYYGLLLAFCQVSGWNRVRDQPWFVKGLSWAITFALIVLGWSIFRAPSLTWLVEIWLHSPWGASGNNLIALLSVLTMIAVYALPLLLQLLVSRTGHARRILEPAFYALLAAILVIFSASGLQDFVYTAF